MVQYYTKKGTKIYNPIGYAETGAPMYETKYSKSKNINEKTSIYKLNLECGKKYIGKTTDIDRRMNQHFSGNGSQVTKKFKPIDGEIIDEVNGFFSDNAEQEHTDKYIKKYGYENVRGGKYVNSKTFHKSNEKSVTCFKCGKVGHYANQCYSKNSYSQGKKKIKNNYLIDSDDD